MDYVLIFAKAEPVEMYPDAVLLVEKNRPAFQAGKLNLPGGKIEETDGDGVERIYKAAFRELTEETGLNYEGSKATWLGSIFGDWGIVYCVHIPVWFAPPKPRKEETEVVAWHSWKEIKNNKKLMPNLKVIIPLMQSGMAGWEIYDNEPAKEKSHSFNMTLRLEEIDEPDYM